MLVKNNRNFMFIVSFDCIDCIVCKYMKVFNVKRRYFKVLSFIVLRYERIEEESEEKLYVLDKLEIFRSGVWYNCSEFGDSVFF